MKWLFLIWPLLWMVELMVGGPGFWTIGLGISLRKVLFIISLCSLYVYVTLFVEWKINNRDKRAFLIIVITIIIWELIMPLIHGTPVEYVTGDGASLLILFVYFPLVQLVRQDIIKWDWIEKIYIRISMILAVVHVFIWITVLLNPGIAIAVRIMAIDFFGTADAIDSNNMIYVGPMPDGFFRVMWISTLYLIPALFLVLKQKPSIFRTIKLLILFFALIVSYTRAVWVGLILSFAVMTIVKWFIRGNTRKYRISYWKLIKVCSWGSALVFFCWYQWDNLFDGFIWERFSSLFTDGGGVDWRMQQYDALINAWTETPVFGTGFGGQANFVIDDGVPYKYEMISAAMLMKFGLVGILMWACSICYYVFCLSKRELLSSDTTWLGNFIGASCAFIFPAMTNPYLFNFVGMSIVLFYWLQIENRLAH
ncbi:MAG: hypothetical protein H6Q73_4127 [Firmicutes bacterium]|nr:hypothetical protein [Bacillota bacterium]